MKVNGVAALGDVVGAQFPSWEGWTASEAKLDGVVFPPGAGSFAQHSSLARKPQTSLRYTVFIGRTPHVLLNSPLGRGGQRAKAKLDGVVKHHSEGMDGVLT
ncbi:MAG: hypothetical protein LBQ43_02715 [Holosporales bacterium]|nr:hypothetical protein [Holosporales bacterium]